MTESNAPKIESQDLSVGALFKDFYSVPDFQREYVWQREQVEKLLQDLYDEFYDEEGRILSGPEYFLGSIVACKSEDGAFQLIDGQQRMTTLYLILCVVRDLLQESGNPSSKVLDSQISDAAIDPRTYEEIERFRVTLQYQDSEGVLDKIASGDTPLNAIPETTASVRNILSACQDIREFITTNLDPDPRALRELHGVLATRVKLIRIVTPTIANALKVFETINDRGVGLNAMDLLKNLLFMRAASKDYPRLKERWKKLVDTLDACREKPLRFLRYYIMAHYETDSHRVIREDEIYDWLVKHAAECGIVKDPLGFLEQLIECSGAHAYFLACKDARGRENRYLLNLALLGGALRQQYILLMAARNLPPELFSRLCKAIENLVFCYIITREPTKTFERNFAYWSSDLRSIKSEAELNAFIEKYFVQDMASRAERFEFAFRELSQNLIQQYRIRYVLAKLTQFIEEQAWGNPAHGHLDHYVAKNVEIEHILPSNPRPDVRSAFDKIDEYNNYTGRLGNLTLLEKTINATVSNGSFSEKSIGYRQSAFLLTKSLVEKPQVGVNTQLNRAVADLPQFGKWSSSEIEHRQQMLAKLARRVWDVPERKVVLPTPIPAKTSPNHDQFVLKEIDVAFTFPNQTLNDLLAAKGIRPTEEKVLVMRHVPSKFLSPLAAAKPDLFNAFQRSQGERAENALKQATWLVSFIGHEPNKAVFVGLYKNLGNEEVSFEELWTIPENLELKRLGLSDGPIAGRSSLLWFNLELTGILQELKGKLIVNWPPPNIAWVRFADRNTFLIEAILPESIL